VRLLLVGLSHRTAPIELRERFAVDDTQPVLAKLVAADEIDEAFLLSTCNRTEALVATRALEAARHRLRSLFLRDLAGDDVDRAEVEAALYEYTDSSAMQHLFRVAASLDSMVVGEPQILGQVKDAYRAAAAAGATGVILGRLLNQSLATAKRVRSETRIAERPVSVARVAVDLARQIFESLADKTALLIGAGDMGEVALEALRAAGLGEVAVANRTPERAGELARRFGARAHGLDELPALLERADVVLTSVGGGEPLITPALVEAAMHRRRHRPMFVIDIGVPRNVAPAVNELDAVYLYDLDDLDAVAASNAEQRRRETVLAEAIVLEEQQRFDGWLAALNAVPTIRHLRARGEAVRQTELERGLRRLDLTDAQRRGVEEVTRRIVNKLLHAPVSRLRAEAEREEGLAYLEAARVLFALDDPAAPGAEADPESEPPDPEGAGGRTE
jgi:glutamyl-tRNA reductase